MSGRVKGNDVKLTLTQNGDVVPLALAKSVEFTHKLELLESGYLGETTNQYDTVYKGVSGEIVVHVKDVQPFLLINGVVARARGRVSGDQYNLSAVRNLPDGTKSQFIIPDIYFGEIKDSIGGREEYEEISIPFAASESTDIPA